MHLGKWVDVKVHSYHAFTHVCVGSCMCGAEATALSKLQSVGRPLGVHRSGRHGGRFLLSEVPASSTQFLLRVREGDLTYPANCGGASGAVSKDELRRFAGQMGQCVSRLCRVILAD